MSEMHIYGNLQNDDGEQLYENTNFMEDKGSSRKKPTFLVALDLGNSYCGYSFAPASSPKEITLNKNWATRYAYTSLKTPTAVFGSADKRRKAIGFEASEHFEEDFDTTGRPGMLLNFKNKITRKAVNKKSRKRSLKCTEILLKELKDHAISAISKKYDKHISSDEIGWFIPVPSVWTRKDCDKIGRKAMKAGMVPDAMCLTTVKESHAAFAQCISQKRYLDKPPKKAMLINAGGWDIEVSLFSLELARDKLQYRKLFDNHLGFGGNYINDLFFNYLSEKKALGAKFVEVCKERNPAAWLDLRKQFEQVKQGSAPDSKLTYTMQLLPSFGDLFYEVRNDTLVNCLKDNKDLHLSKRDGKLVLSNRKMQYFYNWAMWNFTQEMIRIMGDYQVNTIDKVFLTGGFGSSSHLQAEVRKFFPGKPVIIPENGNMCAANGCLMKEAGVVKIVE